MCKNHISFCLFASILLAASGKISIIALFKSLFFDKKRARFKIFGVFIGDKLDFFGKSLGGSIHSNGNFGGRSEDEGPNTHSDQKNCGDRANDDPLAVFFKTRNFFTIFVLFVFIFDLFTVFRAVFKGFFIKINNFTVFFGSRFRHALRPLCRRFRGIFVGLEFVKLSCSTGIRQIFINHLLFSHGLIDVFFGGDDWA